MSWMRRIGLVGFLFFLLKGLAWLLIPLVVYWSTSRAGPGSGGCVASGQGEVSC